MPRGYMDAKQKVWSVLLGLLLLLTGVWMLLRIYPFKEPLSMPNVGVETSGIGKLGGAMAWFWWIIGGFILPLSMIYFGGWMVVNGFRG